MNPNSSPRSSSTALRTDHSELTMLEAARRSGVAAKRATFELFTRRLPEGRRYGVVGGLGRATEAIEAFRFGPDELAFLRRTNALAEATIDHLADYRFHGTIRAYREGELHFPHSPVLTVESTFGEGVILETLLLSILNHDSAIAAAASRMVTAAEGRPLIEMGGRRAHEDAAVAAARMAYLCGFASTSNLEAGRRYGVPTRGTAAHAFTLAHDDELAAFRAQVAASGPDTTLLVDTYDIEQGIRNAVEAAGPTLGAIRIDSGDPAEEAADARRLLDELGAHATRIVVTGDMDEYTIEELVSCGAPIDGYGVGTRLVTGSGHPTSGFVYKLVAVEDDAGGMRSVAKRSTGKVNVGGAKTAARVLDADGFAVAEVFSTDGRTPATGGRRLQVDVIVDGEVVHRPTDDEIRAHHRRALAELRPLDRATNAGPAVLTATPMEAPTT
jgi:nicotinate phosphoribosyltransferase